MSSWEDGPPEPDPAEERRWHQQEAAKNAPTVTISGLTMAAVEAAVDGAVRGNYDLSKMLEEKIAEHVEEVVGKSSAKGAEAVVAAAVADVIERGIPVFNTYNGKEESRRSIQQMIEQSLTTKMPADGYHQRPAETIVERMIREKIASLFDKEFNQIVAEAKAGFKSQVDAVLKAKLAETLKSALGLG